MADKLVAVRIKQQDGTYSNEIPIGTLVENVAYSSTKTLLEVLGTVDLSKGDIQTQLDALFLDVASIGENIAEAVDQWIEDNQPEWQTDVPLDSTLTSSDRPPVSNAVPKLIAVNESPIQGTKLTFDTTNSEALNILTDEDIDDTLNISGALADAKATGTACDTLAGDFAATYVPDQAYAVGDYCTYQYQLYQCKTAIAVNTDHTFVTSHWNLITVTDTINDQVDDLKTQFDYNTDILTNSLKYRYVDFIQGTIGSDGSDVDNNNWVRTADFIPIESLISIVKPVGVALGVFYYDATKTYLNNVSWSYSTDSSSDYEEERKNHPTAKYIKIRARMYNGSTAQTTTPGMIIASNLNILLATSQDIINNNISKGYLDLSNLTLTGDYNIEIPYGTSKYQNMLFTIRCKYSGTQPTLNFIRAWEGTDGRLHEYYMSANLPIGGSDFVENTFRVAPFFKTSGNLKVLFTIPSGTTLTIDHMYNSYSDNVVIADNGINLNAHGKCGGGAPINTMAAFELASKMGYKYCITIPKVTSDGVYVCLHDNDGIQATARNDDGTQIASEYQNRAVSTFTYSELLQFDFGINRGVPFKGERIPKLEDFFKLCAKTGMHPMLSCHPSLSGHWDNIKNMAQKYGVLDKLNIKCDQSNITVMMDALGGDIESYTIDESDGVDRTDRMLTLISRYSIDTTKCRCGVEYITTITDALIQSALNAGLFVGYANYLYDATKVKELIDKGVTEFTDDYIGCVGLNW